MLIWRLCRTSSLVALGLVWLAGGCGSPAVTGSPSATPQPTPSPTASPSATPGPADWNRFHWVALESHPGGSPFAWSGGYVTTVSTEAAFEVWSSSDGVAFERGTVFEEPENLGFDFVAEGPGGLVALGSGSDCVADAPGPPCRLRPVEVWASRDGHTWQALADLSPFGGYAGQPVSGYAGPGVGAVTALAGNEHGYVAVGAAVWQSSDGRTWRKLGAAAIPPGASWVYGAVGFDGGFVLTGTATVSGRDRLAMWFSRDGASWHRTLYEGNPLDASLEVSHLPNGALLLVLLPGAGTGPAPAWVSKDGVAWQRIVEDHPRLWADGVHALALDEDPSGSLPATQAWSTQDGLSWARIPIENATQDTPGWLTMGPDCPAALGPAGLLFACGWLLAPGR